MKVAWRAVRGYEGIYEVSSCGKFRSLDRVSWGGKHIKGKMRTPSETWMGRDVMLLCKGGKKHCKQFARIVAETWIPNPLGLECVIKTGEGHGVGSLKWATRHEATILAGTGKPSKILDRKAQAVRNASIRRSKMSRDELAVEHNLTVKSIRRILRNGKRG